jgi:hypothetical protein
LLVSERFLFKVEDTFQISRLGLVLAPGMPLDSYDGPRQVNLKLVKSDGEELMIPAEVYYPFLIPAPKEPKNLILIRSLSRSEVPIGTDVWLIE